MNLLFVCTENRLRSPTAEAVFSQYEGIEALSAGISPSATTTVSRELIEWADMVFAMEEYQRALLAEKFRDLFEGRQLVCLDIPDMFAYMDPVLVKLLEAKVSGYIRPAP